MKNIIVCCDGTWNKPGNADRGTIVETNVQKIHGMIAESNDDLNQVKFYGQGVGTGFSIHDHIFGGSFGKGIDGNIQDAYKFIMWNYQPGDRLFLFGFSRGAYTVRSLSGLIRNAGILKSENLSLVSEAYHLYRDRSELTHPDSDLVKAFKKTYCCEVNTRMWFIGVWDTVGALGIPASSFNWYNNRYQFHDVKLSSQVDNAYHALAIDEQRTIFEPSLWEVGEKSDKNNNQVCEQVWFPGVHSNVGGGYKDTGLSDIALLWMIEKAKRCGLRFDESKVAEIKEFSDGELRDSSTGLFAITPRKAREINKGVISKKNRVTGKWEDFPAKTNESIHYSCFEKCYNDKKYNPKNIRAAYKRQTPFDPTKENWKETWSEYLTGW